MSLIADDLPFHSAFAVCIFGYEWPIGQRQLGSEPRRLRINAGQSQRDLAAIIEHQNATAKLR
jgi:hypothetical protein